jgi:hypothetical protein
MIHTASLTIKDSATLLSLLQAETGRDGRTAVSYTWQISNLFSNAKDRYWCGTKQCRIWASKLQYQSVRRQALIEYILVKRKRPLCNSWNARLGMHEARATLNHQLICIQINCYWTVQYCTSLALQQQAQDERHGYCGAWTGYVPRKAILRFGGNKNVVLPSSANVVFDEKRSTPSSVSNSEWGKPFRVLPYYNEA